MQGWDKNYGVCRRALHPVPSLKWAANNFKDVPCYSKATAKPFVEKNNKSVEALNVYLTSFRDEIQDLIMDFQHLINVLVDSKTSDIYAKKYAW